VATPSPVQVSLPVVARAADAPGVPELVVVSGKGGTGKTSVVASFAALAADVVVADCDVDAADLHLVLEPAVREQHAFFSGHEAVVREDSCDGCATCLQVCRFGAVRMHPETATCSVDPIACEGCGVCAHVCPAQAIDLEERRCGDWFVSDTRYGPMVHARLGIAAESSGKLVTLVRRQAQRVALARRRSAILLDGPPGIGCPVIAAMTGARSVLVVTEPTVSGIHDLRRVLELTRHFAVAAAVCVNRWDLNRDHCDRIEAVATELGAIPVGRIRYDPAVTAAQVERRTVVEQGGGAAEDITVVWERVRGLFKRATDIGTA
jgi:MinD superfamily P-loop ATPase